MGPRRNIALVYATHNYVGGAERFLNQLATHLAELGHAVTIVCRRHESAPHPAVRFERLALRFLGNAWRTWAFARAVEKHVASSRYDIVVGLGRTWSQDVVRCGGCHRTYLEMERRHLMSRWERLRGKGALKGWVALQIERRAFAPGCYRRILVNSQMIERDIMRRYPVRDEDLAVVYNGVDPERFHPRLRAQAGAELRRVLGIGSEEMVLLMLGSGYARKGLRPLLESLPEVVRQWPALRLLVAGRDKRRSDYEALAHRLGLGDRVHFLGWSDDAEVCFAAADLFVLPTVYDSFAYTVLEALASGIPVVTTANAGAAELIEPGVHGEVLPADFRPADLARALLAWVDPAKRKDSVEALRAKACEHTIERCMQQASRIILEVAAQLEREGRRASPAERG
ncbi:MAG: glycosyltransferase family 1 protein [Deltaproteobacteria bacterium]|nr:MAG: glycosyltransferase family 1 protein [Deltaproteobacteria bacterium]